MSRVRSVLLLSAAAGGICLSAQAAPLVSFSLNLPAPTVAVNQALSPNAVAARLAQQGFRVQEMYRKGPAYAVTATGRSGNKVLLMVDGHSGTIIGMSVLTAVTPVAPLVDPNARFVDDTHPFGAVVPEVIYDHWDRYNEPQWQQPGPAAIAITPTYAPYKYAVPYKFVYSSPRTGKSYAVAPPNYRGYQLRDNSGRQIQAAETRADAADAAAAYEAERADQATYDKAQALRQAEDASQQADDLQKQNAELSDIADAQQKRAEEAEQQRQDAEAKAGDAEQQRQDAEARAADAEQQRQDAEARATAAEQQQNAQGQQRPAEPPAVAEQPPAPEQATPAQAPAVAEQPPPPEEAAPAQAAAVEPAAAPEPPAPQEPPSQAEPPPQDSGGADNGGGQGGGDQGASDRGGSDQGGGDNGGGGGDQ